MSGRLRLLVAAASLAAVAALPAAAHASLIDTSDCDGAPLSQPFARWGDNASYKLAPGGDFENGAEGWTLKGGASVVGDNEPWGDGSSALSLAPGASGMSAGTCVNAAYPSFRFFARSSGGLLGLLPLLKVDLVYRSGLLAGVALPLGTAVPSSSWAPSPVNLTLAAVASAVAGGEAPLSLRFTAVSGTWKVDDVYVDPHQRG